MQQDHLMLQLLVDSFLSLQQLMVPALLELIFSRS